LIGTRSRSNRRAVLCYRMVRHGLRHSPRNRCNRRGSPSSRPWRKPRCRGTGGCPPARSGPELRRVCRYRAGDDVGGGRRGRRAPPGLRSWPARLGAAAGRNRASAEAGPAPWRQGWSLVGIFEGILGRVRRRQVSVRLGSQVAKDGIIGFSAAACRGLISSMVSPGILRRRDCL